MNRVTENLDYIPLNSQSLKRGTSFGPREFTIKPTSHHRHLEYLKRENKGCTFDFTTDFLFPFEMFSLPRVLSGRYKKLNEVLSVQCERTIHRLPNPEEVLRGDVCVNNVFEKYGLCFGYFTSRTVDVNNEVLMISLDKVLLINGSDISSVRESIAKASADQTSVPEGAEFVGDFTFQFRHSWDESLWLNNIHTDIYAQHVGFDRGLIEAPAYVDVFLSNASTGSLLKEGIKISWRYQKPLYRDTQVSAYLGRNGSDAQLLIYEKSSFNSVMKVLVQTL
jgi:hypothetical protein